MEYMDCGSLFSSKFWSSFMNGNHTKDLSTDKKKRLSPKFAYSIIIQLVKILVKSNYSLTFKYTKQG